MRQILSSVVSLFLVCLVAKADNQSADDITQFKDVISITLRMQTQYLEYRTVVINDPIEIKRIVDSIMLNPKETCACAHSDSALFRTKQAAVNVSFCNHCFDLSTGNRFVSYEMPPAVYERILKNLPPISNGPILFGLRPLGLIIIFGGLIVILAGLAIVWRKATHRNPQPSGGG